MGRYVNWFLIMVGLTAAAVLTAEGTLGRDFINTELSELLCVITAVPPVIAAIRVENARRIQSTNRVVIDETRRLGDTIAGEIRGLGDRLQAAIAETSQAHAEEMIRAVAKHADRTCKNTAERIVEAFARGGTRAVMDRESMNAAFTDTGPFQAIR
ncbi:hypothetical protein AB0C10_37125 [Microbispora amethystogenes]|uniref:hypothetical protein n=1 Tax=Microbispora amethystogenes TaxID=1427754 RepID=UPI0033C4A479